MSKSKLIVIGTAAVCGVLAVSGVSIYRAEARTTAVPVAKPVPAAQDGPSSFIRAYNKGEAPPAPDFAFDPMTMGRASIKLVKPPGQEWQGRVQMPTLADGRLNVVVQPDIRVPGVAIVPGYFRFVVEFIQVENCCGEGEQKETKLARHEFDPFRVDQGQALTEPVELPVPHPGPDCNINVQVEEGCYETDADVGGIPTHWERRANQQVTIRADG